MQIAKFMDPRRVAVRPDTDDKPISGGISSVLGRGYPAQLANMKVDHLLMAASAEELAMSVNMTEAMPSRWPSVKFSRAALISASIAVCSIPIFSVLGSELDACIWIIRHMPSSITSTNVNRQGTSFPLL